MIAEQAGRLAARTDLLKPSQVLTRKSFENAIVLLQAIGGSTNAVVHILAIAGRMKGVDLTLDGMCRSAYELHAWGYYQGW
jgi:dihydroxy-acid dehydratase